MLNILQSSSKCLNGCAGCKRSRGLEAQQRSIRCQSAAECTGYGSKEFCPPLIVVAAMDYAARMLALTPLKSFGSMGSAHA